MKSNQWKGFWSYYLGPNGKRKYNDQCMKCIHACKQSYRADIICCPKYSPKTSEGASEKTGL